MKKFILIILFLPLFASAQWNNRGNILQSSSDGYSFRFAGTGGLVYWYPKNHIDSLFANLVINENQVTGLQSDLANRVQYSDIRNAVNFGQVTSEADVAHYVNSNGDNTFTVTGFINYLSPSSSGNTVTMSVSYTDNHGVSQTIAFKTYSGATINSVFDYSLVPVCFRAQAGSTIQVFTTVTGTGTILYEDGAYIHSIQGN